MEKNHDKGLSENADVNASEGFLCPIEAVFVKYQDSLDPNSFPSLYVYICWSAAESGKQFIIFLKSALKKGILINNTININDLRRRT